MSFRFLKAVCTNQNLYVVRIRHATLDILLLSESKSLHNILYIKFIIESSGIYYLKAMIPGTLKRTRSSYPGTPSLTRAFIARYLLVMANIKLEYTYPARFEISRIYQSSEPGSSRIRIFFAPGSGYKYHNLNSFFYYFHFEDLGLGQVFFYIIGGGDKAKITN